MRMFFIATVLCWIAGCQHDRPPLLDRNDAVPAAFSADHIAEPPSSNWLGSLEAEYLLPIVERVVRENYVLAQQREAIAVAQARARVVGADRWPTLSVALDAQRGRAAAISDVADRYAVVGTLRFEVDIWGRLSAAQRAARLDLAAAELRYQRAERVLVAQTASAVFDLISAARLERLFEQRLINLNQALDVIERGYRGGLNEALDVYLAQTTAEQERANIANQRQLVFERSIDLERLAGDYPSGEERIAHALPQLLPMSGHGLPTDLLLRRSDIQERWLEVLAADAELAVAHRNRFPSLTLTASASDSQDRFASLLDGEQLAWSAAAGLVQPIFQGGRLKALESQASAIVQQAEQRYLDAVYGAFAEVETALKQSVTLEERLTAFRAAGRNAQAALELASSQYQRGLVTYTTVLEAQRRSFDAQTTIVQLENQLVRNRVALHLALGGPY